LRATVGQQSGSEESGGGPKKNLLIVGQRALGISWV